MCVIIFPQIKETALIALKYTSIELDQLGFMFCRSDFSALGDNFPTRSVFIKHLLYFKQQYYAYSCFIYYLSAVLN